VRGLSTLYILRRIMRRIQFRVKEQNDDPVASAISMKERPPCIIRANTLSNQELLSTPRLRKATTLPSPQPKEPVPQCVPSVEYGAELPLPCYYFDFIVGTSTGGFVFLIRQRKINRSWLIFPPRLIAVMLGRLRMGIDDAIKQYWILSNYIFRPPRLFFPYDAVKLEESINNVVKEFCGCHRQGEICGGSNELLRQYDYAEEGDPMAQTRLNYSCKV
jgi:hypothetical protein